MAYVRGVAVRYPAKIVLDVADLSGTAGLALTSGYFDGSYSWGSTQVVSYRLVVTINATGSYIKVAKWLSGTYAALDTISLSLSPPFSLIIERTNESLIFSVKKDVVFCIALTSTFQAIVMLGDLVQWQSQLMLVAA